MATPAATAPDRPGGPAARSVAVLLLAAATLALVALAGTDGAPAGAQLLETTTTEEPTTTAPVPETTVPPTTAPPATEPPPPTTAPPASAPAPTTTEAPPPPPETIESTAPPEAPVTGPPTNVVVPERITITQETPDLGAVLTIWALGILGTVATLAVTWWRRRA
jgi:outer membrane biosynthesis protein TonB